jgi:hypothetical protein
VIAPIAAIGSWRIGPAWSPRAYRRPERISSGPRGGRTWWAHLEFTRVNIELTILPKKIEELMNVKGIGEKSFLKLKPHVTVAAGKAGQGEKQ